MLKTEVRGQD